MIDAANAAAIPKTDARRELLLDAKSGAMGEIKISCIIAAKYTELAVRALHEGFGLDRAPG